MDDPDRAQAQTGDLVMAVARRVRGAHLEALASWGVTPSQSRALRVLGSRADGMRPSVLADELHIAPRSATEVADALVERGWVERAPDPTDRRASLLALTETGRDLVAQVDVVRRRASEEVLDVLTPDQRRTLHEILTVVVGEDL
ncbi:DNA-binding transcriptional regulator, MarR family [Nocardioides exalbidus]|uniref:DNA-binding transcriptional regulator, MarR family n=1 Tax=Nocardioides exalbidus TaxID=402596 RepID=A0A1H4XBS5_9ACTN|nr:MarR family transcriptional regulator [Nocardioides exalbidus]SED03053.1 DNA-binding transcriptional regulator, MarR family [Nocardioides exalbidus]